MLLKRTAEGLVPVTAQEAAYFAETRVFFVTREPVVNTYKGPLLMLQSVDDPHEFWYVQGDVGP